MEKNVTIEKKEYAAVDVFKFFCALLVIAIHAKPFVNNFWLDAGIGLITRFAVPYFFASSAYFLFKKLSKCANFQEQKKVYLGYFLRLIKFYAIWYVIFSLTNIFFGGKVGSLFWYIRQFVFPTNGSSLWFIAALIWGTLFVFLLSLKLDRKVVLSISVVFLVIGYLLSTMLSLTKDFSAVAILNNTVIPVIGIQNGLFFAFPYVALGAILAEKQIIKNTRKYICGASIFFIALGIESIFAVVVFSAPFTFLWLSALPMTYFVLQLTLTIELKSTPLYFQLRKMSTLIYVIHGVLIKYIDRIFKSLSLYKIDKENILFFITVATVSIGLSYLIVQLSNKKKLSFLKNIM